MKDHRIYNERLASRGEILISKKAVGNWDNELAAMMNRGKAGRPYAYPESFMGIIAHSMLYFRLPYRQMEGLLRTYNSNNCNCKGIFPMWTVESVFSSLKRMFGEEAVRSRNKENMATELMLKIGLYNRFVR